jgi:multiple sugar transport system substrate-binding protein
MPGPISLYYNVDHFEQAGIEVPSSEWTWDDMRTAAQALTADQNSDGVPDQWGLVYDLWFVPWLYWIWSNGGDVFNADQTQCTLTDPKATEALQYWADLVIKDNVAIPTSELQAMQGSLNAFMTGLVSMYLGNTWDLGQLKEAQNLNWKGVLSPTSNDGNRVWYEHFWCWAMSTEVQRPNLAWQYVRDFIMNRTIDPATATIPPLKQLLPTFDTETNQELGYGPLITLATEPDKFRIPGSGDKWDKISSFIQAELDLVFIGEKTAAEAAETVAPKVDEELARTS